MNHHLHHHRHHVFCSLLFLYGADI